SRPSLSFSLSFSLFLYFAALPKSFSFTTMKVSHKELSVMVSQRVDTNMRLSQARLLGDGNLNDGQSMITESVHQTVTEAGQNAISKNAVSKNVDSKNADSKNAVSK